MRERIFSDIGMTALDLLGTLQAKLERLDRLNKAYPEERDRADRLCRMINERDQELAELRLAAKAALKQLPKKGKAHARLEAAIGIKAAPRKAKKVVK